MNGTIIWLLEIFHISFSFTRFYDLQIESNFRQIARSFFSFNGTHFANKNATYFRIPSSLIETIKPNTRITS